jgi:hypothetical protein
MKLSAPSRLAAGFAAATITAALAMPGIASANPHHNPHHDDDKAEVEDVVEAPELCVFLDEAGNKHGKHWPGWGHHGPSKHGAVVCEEEEVEVEAPAAPAAPASYPVQAKTGSVAPAESSGALVIVTLAAATALGGVAVRRATR